MISNRLLGRGPTEPPGFDPDAAPADSIARTLTHEGVTFQCQETTAKGGEWTVAFGRRSDGAESRAFRLRDDAIVDSRRIERPISAAIASDGTTAVVSDGDPNALEGRLEVFGHSASGVGVSNVDRHFDANLGRPTLSADGRLAAVVTKPPETTVFIFDVDTGEAIVEHAIRGRNAHLLGFHDGDGEPRCYVGRRSNDEPYFALDADGEVVWGNSRYRASRPLSERVSDLKRSLTR